MWMIWGCRFGSLLFSRDDGHVDFNEWIYWLYHSISWNRNTFEGSFCFSMYVRIDTSFVKYTLFRHTWSMHARFLLAFHAIPNCLKNWVTTMQLNIVLSIFSSDLEANEHFKIVLLFSLQINSCSQQRWRQMPMFMSMSKQLCWFTFARRVCNCFLDTLKNIQQSSCLDGIKHNLINIGMTLHYSEQLHCNNKKR